MDVKATLYEALARHREEIHFQQALRESSLPRKGKNPATENDHDDEHQRRLRLEALELCLSAVPEMVSMVNSQNTPKPPTPPPPPPPRPPPPPTHISSIYAQSPAFDQGFGCFAPDDDEPYLNPFTGQMVYPKTKYSAGPSGTQNYSLSRRNTFTQHTDSNNYPPAAWVSNPPFTQPINPPDLPSEKSQTDYGCTFQRYPSELPGNLSSTHQGPLAAAHKTNKPEKTPLPDFSYTYQRYLGESNVTLPSINQGPPDAYNDSLENKLPWDSPAPSSVNSFGIDRSGKKLTKTKPSQSSKPWGLLSGLRGGRLRKSDTEDILGSNDMTPMIQPVPMPPPVPPKRNNISVRRNRSSVQAKKKEQQNPNGGIHNPSIVRTVQAAFLEPTMFQPPAPRKVPTDPPKLIAPRPPPLGLLAAQKPPTLPPQLPRANKSIPSINPSPVYASVYGPYWVGIDQNAPPVPTNSRPPTNNEPSTRRPNLTPQVPMSSRLEQKILPKYPISGGVSLPTKNKNEQSRIRAQQQQQQLSQQETQRLQLEADRALAAQLAAEDSTSGGWPPTSSGVDGFVLAQILGDDGGDQDMTSFFEEQQSLLAAYSLQAQESAPRSEGLEHARWLQQREDEYDRQIEEQAEFARKAQEQWAEEDRLFLEKMRKEAEEKYRRDVETMEQARKEEERRQAERKRKEEEAIKAEAERIRRERMAECIACGDELEKTAMLITTCNHAYGGDCLQAAFRMALKSREPFACCGRRVDIGLAARHFDSKFVASYRLLQLERDTPNPLYCSAARCSAFIVPSAIRGDEGICSTCKVKTCRHCRKAAHSGVCSADKDGQETRALANKMGWKECPRCNQIVDRRSGCLHMTCKCGEEFCYSCGKLYSECPGSCRRTS